MSLCIATSSGSGARRISGVWTSEIDSTPPPTTMSILSVITCLAAVAIAISPEAHCRSTDIPATLTGSPARSSDVRAILPA